MKRYFLSFLLFFSFLLKLPAQGMLDVQGAGVLTAGASQNAGGGGGLGFYYDLSSAFHASVPEAVGENAAAAPFHVYAGAEMLLASMGQKNFDEIPLDGTPGESSRVQFQNSLYSFSGGIRCTYDLLNGRVRPYAGLYAGYRCLNSDMKIFPDNEDLRTSERRLASVRGISVGAGAGVIIGLTKRNNFCLSAGAGLDHSRVPGSIVDLSDLQRSPGFIAYRLRPSIEDYIFLKVGITAFLDFKNTAKWRQAMAGWLQKK